MTITLSGEINLQSKQDLISHIEKVKANSMANKILS